MSGSGEKLDTSENTTSDTAEPPVVEENNDSNKEPTVVSPPNKDEHAVEEEKKESSPEKRPLTEDDTAPRRPVKRARTAYFIFAEERRPEIQKQHPGEGVAAVGKALGQLWGSLSAEEKQTYQDKAAEERERVAKDIEAWKKANGGEEAWAKAVSKQQANPTDPWALAYPFAKVRKICKLDPDVKNLSKEALLLVTKAAELATVKLGLESFQVAQMQNRRKLLPDDVAMVCRTRGPFTFLKNDVVDLVKEQKEQNQKEQAKASKSKVVSAPTTSNPISSYFAPKKNS